MAIYVLVETKVVVAYKLERVSPSNIQNSNNNDGLAFYNAEQYFESDCMGNNPIIKTTHKTMHTAPLG